MAEKHRVKVHQWNNGLLDVVIREFDSLVEAIDFCDYVEGESVKVYTHNGHLVHEAKCKKPDTYA